MEAAFFRPFVSLSLIYCGPVRTSNSTLDDRTRDDHSSSNISTALLYKKKQVHMLPTHRSINCLLAGPRSSDWPLNTTTVLLMSRYSPSSLFFYYLSARLINNNNKKKRDDYETDRRWHFHSHLVVDGFSSHHRKVSLLIPAWLNSSCRVLDVVHRTVKKCNSFLLIRL